MFFPHHAAGGLEKSLAEHLRRRAMLQLDGVLGGQPEAHSEAIRKIDEYLFLLHNPQRLDGAGGLEVRLKLAFDEVCDALKAFGHSSPKTMSVREFYGAFDRAKKRGEAHKKVGPMEGTAAQRKGAGCAPCPFSHLMKKTIFSLPV